MKKKTMGKGVNIENNKITCVFTAKGLKEIFPKKIEMT
jgi:hypothetical protein